MLEPDNLNQFVKVSPVKVSDFIKEPELVNFYMNEIDPLLEQYTQGRPENKPDVMKQLEEMNRNREKMVLEYKLQQTQQQAHQFIQQIQSQLSQALLENTHLKEKNEYLENKIKSIITQQINDYKNK